MKGTLFLILLNLIDPSKIGKVNTEKSEAKNAYQRGEFKNAITHYKTLTDSLDVKEDEVTLNLAHSYFQLNDTVNAQNSYLPLTNSTNPHFQSIANQQVGVLTNRLGKFEEALNYFKNALKADPSNEEARYNYEMVKKKLEEKKKQEEQQNKDQKKDDKEQKDDKNKDQKDNKENKDNKDQKDKKDQKDQQSKDQKDQKNKKQQEKEKQQKEEQQKKEQEQKDDQAKNKIPPSVSEKLKEMKMSEDKAKMVLEAMKNQEVQYLQQNKRKATKPKSKGKPDW